MAKYPPKIMKIKLPKKIVDGVIVKDFFEKSGELWARHRTFDNPSSWTISHYRTGCVAVRACRTAQECKDLFHENQVRVGEEKLRAAVAAKPIINTFGLED